MRRSLDAGYSAADLHALFAQRSRTPLPQTLTYLIDDVARRHGGLRVGSAGHTCAATTRRWSPRCWPTAGWPRRWRCAGWPRPCSRSRLAPAKLLEPLRDAGYAPVPEDATGAAVLTPAEGAARRHPGPARVPADRRSAPPCG